jgi:nicotinate-nucleotide adenylyltransferase
MGNYLEMEKNMGSIKKKIGFLGGTFDPIHNGHLYLAKQIHEICKLEKIFLSPAYISPFKIKKMPIASPAERVQMLLLAIEETPFLLVDEGEIQRKEPSYTIDALEIFQKKFSQDEEIVLLMEFSTFRGFDRWKNKEKILENAKLLVGGKKEDEEFFLDLCRKISPSLNKENFIPLNILDISSTDIRERIKKGLSISDLVPPKVLDFISKNRLYL